MSSTIIAEQKLMFYPTSEFETHRLLAILGRVSIKDEFKNELKSRYKDTEIICLDNNIRIDAVIYDKLLQESDYETIKKCFEIHYTHNNNNKPIVICDYFAGEGKWLSSFKDIMPLSDDSCSTVLVANELDNDRYQKIKENPNIDEAYNSSFEELVVPKNACSIMLFNPPYGSSNNERNVRRYLKMILERKILYNPQWLSSTGHGYMVFVIRKDDFLENLDLICQHFEVLKTSIYKTNPEEYKKYKQYVFVAQIKKRSYDLSNTYDAVCYKKAVSELKDIIDSEPEFNMQTYKYRYMIYPSMDYSNIKNKMEQIKLERSSIGSRNWDWIKDITELAELSSEKIQMPKQPKRGEISMLLASGMINGVMNKKHAPHIVVGGVRTESIKEQSVEKDSDGKKTTITKTIKLSKPYLNILHVKDGRYKIKELGDIDVCSD